MKKTLAAGLPFLLTVFFAINVTQGAGVSDIKGYKNETAISYLMDHGIVNGYPDGTFRPDATINRAEFTKIIIGALYKNSDIDGCLADQMKPGWTYTFFRDVDRNAWYAKFICLAKVKGVIKGYEDGLFRPNSTINKAEAVKILVTAQGYSLPDKITDYLYTDVKPTDWFAPYVKVAADKNLLEDTGTSMWLPYTSLTRGAMSEMTYRSLLAGGDTYAASGGAQTTDLTLKAPADIFSTLISAKAGDNIDSAILSVLDAPEKNYVQNMALIQKTAKDLSPQSIRDLMSLGPYTNIKNTEVEAKKPNQTIVGIYLETESVPGTVNHSFGCFPFVYKGTWKLKLPIFFSGITSNSKAFQIDGVDESCAKAIEADSLLTAKDLTNAQISYASPFAARVYLNGHLILNADSLLSSYSDTYLPLVTGSNTLEVENVHDQSYQELWENGLLKQGDFEKMYGLEPNQMKIEIKKDKKSLVSLIMLGSEGHSSKDFDYQP